MKVLKLVKFLDDFTWYGKEFQTLSSKSYLIWLLNFKIKFMFPLFWTVRNWQSENFFYKTRIDIIGSFEDFNTQSAIAANINSSFS